MSEIQRVYCREAAYVATESYQSLPPGIDSDDPERRKKWGFKESAEGVLVSYQHANGRTYFAKVPWSNIRGVTYFDQQTAQVKK